MKIIEITRPVEINDADKILRGSGYEDLQHSVGHTRGTFARVFMKPGQNYVLKLFDMKDFAYRRYLGLITSVRNVHFPVVRGRPVRVSNFYYGVRLELLTPFDKSRNDERKTMDRYLDTLMDMDENQSASHRAVYEPVLQSYSERLHPETKQALDLIYGYCLKGHSGTIADLHMHNVMMRGDTIVIIDPVAYGNESNKTPYHSTFDKFPAYVANKPVAQPNWLK
jgi:hypothetical protein